MNRCSLPYKPDLDAVSGFGNITLLKLLKVAKIQYIKERKKQGN
jgi:hypothetical protein